MTECIPAGKPWTMFNSAVVYFLFAGAFWIILMALRWQETATDTQMSADVPTVSVKTTLARRGPSLEVGVEQPAFVAPYYRVELNAQASGTVSFIEKEIGDRVTAGERLVEISSPSQDPMTLKAPFDGVVARRGVDPGAFVQDATVVPGVQSLMTVERTDIVTISMNVPEAYVALISKETEAVITMDALPGTSMRAKITRMSPSLRETDRTLRVEVDLYNGTEVEYRQFVARAEQNGRADLKSRTMPSFPERIAGTGRLLPGMYGTMRLLVRSFKDVDLWPSQVVSRKGGVPFVFVVEAGIVKKIPVVIEFDDGTLCRLTGQGLTRTSEIVVSNQGELSEGQKVEATLGNP